MDACCEFACQYVVRITFSVGLHVLYFSYAFISQSDNIMVVIFHFADTGQCPAHFKMRRLEYREI